MPFPWEASVYLALFFCFFSVVLEFELMLGVCKAGAQPLEPRLQSSEGLF
jgi:hypothetical protein